jgi:small subunit ribosomal protein S20
MIAGRGGVGLATKSAAKAHRQALKRRLRNRAVKSFTKTMVKRAEAAISSGDLEAAQEAVRQAISALDRAVKKGVLHPNNAARGKSRLMKKLNALLGIGQGAS